ncbi:DUF4180 domain-containing protein [bacterium]|nr:MAG: DUF4180 domain-containing protein [bacterium]
MRFRVVNLTGNKYIECLPDGGLIESERDALDLVAICGENQIHRLMIHASNLADDFYHLSTGLAGTVLLKFSNYSVKVAAILPPEQATQGYFKDMVLEANRRNRLFHVFYDPKKAGEWLVAE